MVYIIIVNYNGSQDTIECIKSLSNIKYKNYKIVVVDNNSQKNDVEKLEKYNGNEIELIKLDENLGFAKANNIGMKIALKNNAEYVLLINNDTTVEEDFLGKLIDTFSVDDKIGVSTGKILNYYDINDRWYDGAKINWFKFEGQNDSGKSISNDIREVNLISGCLMLIKREVLEKGIFLPEEYFMYYEDIDYSVAINEAGYKLAYNNKSIIYHKISKSTGGEKSAFYFKYSTRNWMIFMHKYQNYSKSILLSKLYYYVNRYMRVIFFILTGKKEKAKSILNGIKDGKIVIKNMK